MLNNSKFAKENRESTKIKKQYVIDVVKELRRMGNFSEPEIEAIQNSLNKNLKKYECKIAQSTAKIEI